MPFLCVDLPPSLLLLAALALGGCSTAQAATTPKQVTPAPPPKDDGKTAQAQGAPGGEAHAAALEELKVATTATRADKQGSVLIPLPDADHWTRVRFLTVKSLVGFRYGKDHHAVLGAFVTHVDDNTVQGACNKSFEAWAQPWVEAFEVEIKHDAPTAFSWSPFTPPKATPTIAIVDVDPLRAKTATILSREAYTAAWSAYPAWERACLIVGVAVPDRDEGARAREVRDRFVRDVLPNVKATSAKEPPEAY